MGRKIGIVDNKAMDNSLTVFLCSTFVDLATEREAVLDAIRKLQLQHDSMEFFGARSDQPLETCLAEVRRSHILVVIISHRYGSIAPDLGISFSEAEYTEGTRLRKPCLVYMLDENVPVLPKHIERDPDKLRKLDRWKAKLRERHTVATFSNANELAVSVAADLARTIQTLAATDARRSHDESSAAKFQDVLAESTALGVSSDRLLSMLRQAIREATSPLDDRQPRVFFSYSHADAEAVRKVADGLRATGVEVWIDEAELKPGDNINFSIERGLDSADFVAFFISGSSLSSHWARQELDAAISRQVSGGGGAILLPILLEDVEIPPLLRMTVYLDMRDGNIDRATNLLAATINRQFDRIKGIGDKIDKTERFRAYVLMTSSKAPTIAQARSVLSDLSEVVEVTETYGSVDLVAVLAANDLQRIRAIVELINTIPDIGSTMTLLGT